MTTIAAVGCPGLRIDWEMDPDRWNATVAAVGGGVFHNRHYLATLYRPTTQVPFLAALESSDGRTEAACAGLVTNTAGRPWMKAFTAVHLAAYPAAIDSGCATRAVDAIATSMQARGCIALSIDGLGANAPVLPPALGTAQLTARAEFRLSLEPDLDRLHGSVAKKRRAAIRRADRASLRLRIGREFRDLMIVRALMRESSARAQNHSGEAFAIPSEDKLQSMATHLLAADLAAVYIAERDGAAVSANVVAAWNRQAYNLLAGSSEQGFAIGAASWLYWRVIENLKSRGFAEFNLGGVDPAATVPGSPGHGLFDFKRDFGGTLVACPDVLHVMRPARFRWYQRLQRIAGRSTGVAA